ncbi:MAG: T9SS type A sorting domain-containing protein [Bacteroidota bacterium]
MKNLTITLLLLTSISCFSQMDIGTLSEARYGISTAIMGDTLIFAGGDDYDMADFYTTDGGVIDVQFYGSDGFGSSDVVTTNDIALFYGVTNVNTVIRNFYKYNRLTNEWSDGKYPADFDDDFVYLDGDLLYSHSRFDRDSTSVINIVTNETYKELSGIAVREFGIVQTDDKVYCVGGITQSNDLSNELNVYDLTTKEWSTHLLERARREPNAIVHNNKLIINGGFNDFSKEVEIVDLTTFESQTFDLPTSNRDALLVASGETLIAAGGFRNSAVVINLNTLEVAEPHVLEEEAINSGLDFLQGQALGEEIIFGGDRWPNFHIYNTTSQTWTVIPMDAVRRSASMFKYKNRVYFVGGRDNDNNNSDAITVFENTSSTNEGALTGLTIYPNPTSDFITIDFDEGENSTLELYNQQGRLMYNGQFVKNLDISNYTSGLYNLKVQKGNLTVIKKMIVH